MGDIGELLFLLGADDADEALACVEAERQGMRELHDENRAVRIYGARMYVVVDRAMRCLQVVESETGLMLTPKLVARIVAAREAFEAMKLSLAELRNLVSFAAIER